MTKKLILLSLLFISMVSCTSFDSKHDKVEIIKKIENKELFLYQSYKGEVLMKSRFKLLDNKIQWKIDYSSNGWQITDSTSFRYLGNICVKKYYTLDYDKQKSKQYLFREKYIDSNYQFKYPFKDDYQIFNFFISENLINACKDCVSFPCEFKKNYNGIQFMYFAEFGLTYDAFLDSLKVNINKGALLVNDTYYLRKYKVNREFHYKEKLLKKINITITNNETGMVRSIEQYFK